LLTGHVDSQTRISRIYRNDEGDFNISASLTGVEESSVAWGDYDNDGDLDILLTGNAGSDTAPVFISKIYRNDNGSFLETPTSLIGVGNSSAAWGDYDNDGDLDILLTGYTGSTRVSKVYRNDNGSFVDTNASLLGVRLGSVAWGDYDNDGDLDILLVGQDNNLGPASKVYRNDDGSFMDIAASLDEVKDASVAWGDFDNDGDLDILITGSGNAKVYINDRGSFVDASANLPGVSESSAAWGDYDNDGDFDILLTGNSSLGRITKVYKNNNGAFAEDPLVVLPGVDYGAVAWGDYDNDNDLDILLTGRDNNAQPVTKIYRNNTTTKNAVPAAPPNLLSTIMGYTATLSWNRATDSRTRDRALTYNLRLGTLPDSVQKVSPMADVNTGYRRVPQLGNMNHQTSWTIKNLPSGTYYWGVQAIDNDFAGSAFAPEQSFTVPPDIMPPAAPQMPALTASAREGEAILTWKANSEIDLASYRIYRNETPLATTLIDTTAPAITTYIDSSLAIYGVTYYYRITAVDYAGNESAFSNEISATPPLTPFAEIPSISQVLGDVSDGSVAWGDYDNDVDLDILLTGSGFSSLYRNTGTILVNFSGAGLMRVSNSSSAWGDYDKDGYLDILITGNGTSKVYLNVPGGFQDIKAQLVGISDGSVAWGDYDNDGDLDILLTGRGASSSRVAKIYRNDGSDIFSDINAQIVGVYYSSVAWGDYDNDGDLDIFLTGLTGSGGVTKLYKNESGSFVEVITTLPNVYYSAIALGDYDLDGDLDILLTGRGNSGVISKIFHNDNDLFVDIAAPLPGVEDGSVAWGDYDNDGDLDILLTGSADSGPLSKIFQNNAVSFVEFPTLLMGVRYSSVAWGDVDGDDDLDVLLTGDSASGRVSKVYRNNASTANTSPTAPSGLTHAISGNSATLSWNKATDSQTAQNGLTYNLRVGTITAGIQKVSPMADVETGYRRLPQLGSTNHRNVWGIKNLPNGKYFWSVQAIDNAFAGSVFAAEVTFRITATNQPPRVIRPISDQTLAVGGIPFISVLDTVFFDPNGDVLKYTTISSDSGVAKASRAGNTLTVTPVDTGLAMIFLAAMDDSATVQDTFNVKVVDENLRPIVINRIPNQSLTVGGPPYVRDLNASPKVFSDPNGDALIYSANSNAINIATTNIPGSTLTVAPIAVGTAMITVTASDGRGGMDSTMFQVSVMPSGTAPTARTELVVNLDSTSVTVTGTVNPNGLSTIVVFQYGMTTSYGSQVTAIQSPVIGTSEVGLSASITGLSPGTTYHYRVVATNSMGTTNGADKTFMTYPRTLPINTTVSFPSRASASDYQATDYRIIGLPGASNQLVSAFLSGQQNRDWQVYWDNGAASNFFVAFDGSANFQFTTGRAFWIINKGSLSINTTVPAAPLNANQQIEISLQAGWNLITNPFTSSVAWSRVQSANGNITEPIWAFNGSHSQSTSFDPYVGYYFFNSRNLNKLVIPYSLYFSPANSPISNFTGWQVNMALSSGEFSDKSTYFGVSSEASRALDHLDQRKPRAVGALPEVSFHRPEWDANFSTFATDIRPEFNQTESWDFEVRTTQRQNCQLTLDGVQNIPEQFEVYLIDESRGKYVNAREQSSYEFMAVGEVSKFRVVVGNQESVQEDLNAVHPPTEFVLGKNYPNPFNPTTIIPLAIPLHTEIELRVYNLLGQEVKTIYTGSIEAGRYDLSWDGRDDAGQALSSGIYLYRLTTRAGVNLTGRMVLLK